jgi:hypothetical protein
VQGTIEGKAEAVRVFSTPAPAAKPIEEPYEGWDGTEMGFKLAHPMIFNLVVVGPGDVCMFCGADDHHVHAKVSPVTISDMIEGVRVKRVEWVGPDADNVRGWFRFGLIFDSDEARARDREQAEIDHDRGTFGTKENPTGFPSLAALTTEGLRAQHRQALGAGPTAARNRERQEVRAAQSELIEVLRLLGVDVDAWVGAVGAGSKRFTPQEAAV